MGRTNALYRLLLDEGGETILEFALISVIFFTLMCAFVEYGLILMTKVALESATQHVARSSGINGSVPGCSDRACAIKTLIAQKTIGVVINPANVIITSEVISSPTEAAPASPDVCTDTTGVPSPPTCTRWQENNGIPGYQQNNPDAGSTNDLVQISVFYQWQIIFPLLQPFFTGGVDNLTTSTVIKNEPF
jgi:hypothetical protein